MAIPRLYRCEALVFAAGIVLRLVDSDNYYVLRANALEDNVNFYRVMGGNRREIQGASAKVPSDTWCIAAGQLCSLRPGILDACYQVWLAAPKIQMRVPGDRNVFTATLKTPPK